MRSIDDRLQRGGRFPIELHLTRCGNSLRTSATYTAEVRPSALEGLVEGFHRELEGALR